MQNQWQFGSTTGDKVYELRIQLSSPGIFPPAKADIPLPGLPTLDGFLKFLAFQAALRNALQLRPDLAQSLLWQWTGALKNLEQWIDFSIPIRRIQMGITPLYDCSIGLPVVAGNMWVPAGAFFVEQQYNLRQYPAVADSISLRRRVAEPLEKPFRLKSQLNSSSGKNKALNNRVYYSLTTEYVFCFRGDANGVERLLRFACDNNIGIGKKTTLGYGRIAAFNISGQTQSDSTLAISILDGQQRALLKTVPYYSFLAQREQALENKLLFGCEQFRLVNALETVGACYPPYWPKENQVHVLQYGTIITEYSE